MKGPLLLGVIIFTNNTPFEYLIYQIYTVRQIYKMQLIFSLLRLKAA